MVADFFIARVAVERAAQISRLLGSWRPDLLLRDEMDVGAGVAAEAGGVPSADVVVIAAGRFVAPDLVRAPLEALRTRHGLRTGPAHATLRGNLTLEPVLPGLRDPADPLPRSAVPVRPTILDDVAALHREARPRTCRRSVYLTLGSIFGQESGDLFPRVLAGLRELGIDVLVTVGRELDPAELGPQPPHIRVERFLPLAEVLAGPDLVICHPGSGTVVATLALELPSLLLPLGADQPWTADRCAALGVSRVLDPLQCAPADVATTVLDLLQDGTTDHRRSRGPPRTSRRNGRLISPTGVRGRRRGRPRSSRSGSGRSSRSRCDRRTAR
ncbi:MAG: glycosyltransferase, family [Frankiales bacterium]|nr:glycosyltransferase, family [Frankiales bacterium]